MGNKTVKEGWEITGPSIPIVGNVVGPILVHQYQEKVKHLQRQVDDLTVLHTDDEIEVFKEAIAELKAELAQAIQDRNAEQQQSKMYETEVASLKEQLIGLEKTMNERLLQQQQYFNQQQVLFQQQFEQQQQLFQQRLDEQLQANQQTTENLLKQIMASLSTPRVDKKQ